MERGVALLADEDRLHVLLAVDVALLAVAARGVAVLVQVGAVDPVVETIKPWKKV